MGITASFVALVPFFQVVLWVTTLSSLVSDSKYFGISECTGLVLCSLSFAVSASSFLLSLKNKKSQTNEKMHYKTMLILFT